MESTAILSIQEIRCEMDVALEAEIKVKQDERKSFNHVAVDGQPLGERGGFHYHQFSLNDPWAAEDDTPVRVQVDSNPPISATIVSSTGTTITIATRESLLQEALQKILLFDDSIELLKRLREVLPNNQEGDAKIGSKILGLEVFSRGKGLSSLPPEIFNLNPPQAQAVQMALGSEVTYIVGPPGTGKTITLAAIALHYLLTERTVLIASHTNIAVDNAVMKLVEQCRQINVTSKLREGKVIRYGATQHEDLKKPEYENIFVSAIVKRRSVNLNQKLEQLEKDLNEIDTLLDAFRHEDERQQHEWSTRHKQAAEQLDGHKRELSRLQASATQRKTVLNAEKVQLEGHYRQANQQLSTINQQLAGANAEYVHLEAERAKFSTQSTELSTHLSAVQQMNKLVRLLKGINQESLEKSLSDVNYQIWCIGEREKEIQRFVETSHSNRAACEAYTGKAIARLQYIISQLSMPSSETSRIATLQATITSLEGHIAVDDRQRQALQQKGQQQKRTVIRKREEIYAKIDEVKQGLQELEKRIVAEAQVVATTLCKTYMNPVLCERRFDVVIVDEISMAPLPSVYIAASRANSSVVAIGDPQQLAPICNAKDNEKLSGAEQQLAKSWLGTDLFSKNHITLKMAEEGYRNSIILTHQYRMHPEISDIANKHVYDGKIEYKYTPPAEDYSQTAPSPGKHLILCDTSDASPVAVKPERSRINIYHALCSIAIARQALLTLPEDRNQEGKQRVGLVTPYTKQAKLLQNLVKDAGLEKLIRVGTVHRFQGLEFDVVIFDTVESLPIPPRVDFIAGGENTGALRLVNVAVTRARHKLIVVANARHIRNARHMWSNELFFPKTSILRKAVEEAQKVCTINSLDLLGLPWPDPSQDRSKETLKGLLDLTKYDPERLFEERLNENTFYPRFVKDLESATKEIVIVSPFLSNKTKELLPLLRRKVNEGISINVITKPLNEYTLKDAAEAEFLLKGAGIYIGYYPKVHMKHAIIDEQIIYDGSLNILSHYDTHESMIRKKSPLTAKIVWDELRKAIKKEANQQAKHLIQSKRKTESQGSDISVLLGELPLSHSVCTFCGHRLIVKLNKKGQPFYGCEQWNSSHPKNIGEDVQERHLISIPQLKNRVCKQCDSSIRVRKDFSDTWIECEALTSCGYWQRILFTK